MTTLTEIKAAARLFIKDPEGAKVSDVEVTSYLNYAIADYSRYFPIRKVAELTPAATVSLPSDLIKLDAVEIDGELWRESILEYGTKIPTSGKYWYWRGEDIALCTTPSTTVYAHYRANHTVLVSGTDVLTVPSTDEELLLVYTAAKFHQKIGTVAAQVDRWKEKGSRDDSPLVMMYDVLMKQYEQKLNSRFHRGTVKMRAI